MRDTFVSEVHPCPPCLERFRKQILVELQKEFSRIQGRNRRAVLCRVSLTSLTWNPECVLAVNVNAAAGAGICMVPWCVVRGVELSCVRSWFVFYVCSETHNFTHGHTQVLDSLQNTCFCRFLYT